MTCASPCAFSPRLASPSTGVVITGAASGFGYAVAQALAAVGRPLALWDGPTTPVAAAADALRSTFGVPVLGQEVDLCRPHAIKAAAVQTRAALPRIGGIVHAAGIVDTGSLEGADLESWTLGINLNLRPLLVLVQTFLVDLRRQPDSAIVAFASLGIAPGGAENPIYSAAMGGVPALVRALARGLQRDAIRVNAVFPPPAAAGPAAHPGFGAPPDPLAQTARVVRLLLSREAGFISGMEYRVDALDPGPRTQRRIP